MEFYLNKLYMQGQPNNSLHELRVVSVIFITAISEEALIQLEARLHIWLKVGQQSQHTFIYT